MYMYNTAFSGDGWNGNQFEIDGDTLEDPVTGYLSYGRSEDEQEVCLEPGCYSLTINGASYVSSYLSWEFGDLEGGVPYGGEFCIEEPVTRCYELEMYDD